MAPAETTAAIFDSASQLERMSWIWYWAILDRESDGFIASIPDLGDSRHMVRTKSARWPASRNTRPSM
jgi:hypothetical protein